MSRGTGRKVVNSALKFYGSCGRKAPSMNRKSRAALPPEMKEEFHGTSGRDRPRHDQLGGVGAGGRRAGRHPQRGGHADHAVRGRATRRTARSSSARSPSGRRSPTPTARSARSSGTWARRPGRWTIDGKDWTPQEVSAQILLKLKRDAEAYLGDTVTQAVVTVPGVLRRRAAPGHQGGRADRRAWRSCASSTSRRPPRWPTGSTRATPTTRCSSSTSAAARSTSRCSRSARASSRSRPPTATRSWAATTGTSGSSTGS